MANLRTYSATFEQNPFANAAVARWRFNETDGSTAADAVDGFDGAYQGGFQLAQAGLIGDGAAGFDGTTGIVLVGNTLTGTVTVAAFGDSLVAGSDLDAGDRYSPNLEAALEARGLEASVLEHGDSGETTTDALDRVDNVIADDPDVVIVALGTNDALQLFDQDPGGDEDTAANLRGMIQDFQAAGIEVLLTGAFAFYPNFEGGRGYLNEDNRDAFEGIFRTVASELDVHLLNGGSDKFLGGSRTGDTITGGVLGSPTLNLDGLHPNAAGVDNIVARTTNPTVAAAAAAGLVTDQLELADGSIELWLTPDDVNGTQMLLSKNLAGAESRGDIEIQLVGNQVAVGLQSNSDTFVVAGGEVQAGDAAHIVFTFGAGGMQLFVDGLLVGSDAFAGGLVGNVEELGIGARANGGLPFHGTIDELAIYDRALTPTQVQALFEGGSQGSTLVGTAAADELTGGSDSERLSGAAGDDLIFGGAGDDLLRGAAGDDDLRGGAGDDDLRGGDGDDVLIGARGDDTLAGLTGADSLFGSADDDRLDGGGGRDSLSGGSGDDLLNGGAGGDSLEGGPGSDTFRIDRVGDGVDTIRDFEAGGGGDALDLHNLLDFQDGDAVSDFVSLTEVKGHTNVGINADGAGNDFTTVFKLIGATGLDLNSLVDDGNVQLQAPPTS